MLSERAMWGLKRLQHINETVRRKTAREAADELIARRESGERLTATQADYIMAVENMASAKPAESDNFKPIPQHLWPPAMRDGGIARDFARELIAKDAAGGYVSPAQLDLAKALLRKHSAAQAAEFNQPENDQ